MLTDRESCENIPEAAMLKLRERSETLKDIAPPCDCKVLSLLLLLLLLPFDYRVIGWDR